MEYQELIAVVAEETKYTKREVRRLLRITARLMREAIAAGRDVQFNGVGRLKNVPAAARVGRNPFTGDRVNIPPTRRLKLLPCRSMAESLERSQQVFKKESLEKRFGLRKGKEDGQVRSRDRSREGPQGKEGGRGG